MRISKCVVYSDFLGLRFPTFACLFDDCYLYVCLADATVFKVFVLLVSFFISRIRMVCYMLCCVFCKCSVCSECCVVADGCFAVLSVQDFWSV